MCLIVASSIPKIADKDIVCYKIVRRTKIKGIYKSSFQEFEYIIRQLYTNNFDIKFANRVIRNLCPSYPRLGIYAIEEGMFHSYVSPLYPLEVITIPNWTMLKCIIPKGAYYYEGEFVKTPSYASSRIKILEEI